MKKIAVALFIVIFFLLRPYALQYNGMWYSGDDQDYFAHSSSIVFGEFPSYQKEYLTISTNYPQGSIGCSLLALPFVWAFSLIDRWEGSSIVHQRTSENIPKSWSQFGFVFASCFYFILATFLLYRGVLYLVEERYAVLATILTVVCQGLPLFAFRRPIFSHSAEFFIQSVFVFLLLRNCFSEQKFPYKLWHFLMLGSLSALIFLTRYNDIGFAILWPLAFLLNSNFSIKSLKHWGRLVLMAGVFLAIVGIFKIWPETYNQYHPYQWVLKEYLSVNLSLGDLLQRIGHIIWGFDWGLVYTAPYILIGLIVILLFNFPARSSFLILLIALLINLFIIVIWGSQGGWYGYRYLIASAIPLFVLPVAILIKSIELKSSRKLTLLWVLIAVPSALSMVFFEGNNTTLTLHVIPQSFGHSDWSNKTYQVAVWKTATNIYSIWQPLFKGGAYYCFYLLQSIGLISADKLDTGVRYPHFEWKVLIRTLIIYLLPLIVAFIFLKIQFKKSKS